MPGFPPPTGRCKGNVEPLLPGRVTMLSAFLFQTDFGQLYCLKPTWNNSCLCDVARNGERKCSALKAISFQRGLALHLCTLDINDEDARCLGASSDISSSNLLCCFIMGFSRRLDLPAEQKYGEKRWPQGSVRRILYNHSSCGFILTS